MWPPMDSPLEKIMLQILQTNFCSWSSSINRSENSNDSRTRNPDQKTKANLRFFRKMVRNRESMLTRIRKPKGLEAKNLWLQQVQCIFPHKLIEKPNAINRDQETKISEPQANLEFSRKILRKQGINENQAEKLVVQVRTCKRTSVLDLPTQIDQETKRNELRTRNPDQQTRSNLEFSPNMVRKQGNQWKPGSENVIRASSVKLDVQSGERGGTHDGFRGVTIKNKTWCPKPLLRVGLSHFLLLGVRVWLCDDYFCQW